MKKITWKQIISALIVLGFGLILIGATVLHLGAGLICLGITAFSAAVKIHNHYWTSFWIHDNPEDRASLQIRRCDDETPIPSGQYWYMAKVFIGRRNK